MGAGPGFPREYFSTRANRVDMIVSSIFLLALATRLLGTTEWYWHYHLLMSLNMSLHDDTTILCVPA